MTFWPFWVREKGQNVTDYRRWAGVPGQGMWGERHPEGMTRRVRPRLQHGHHADETTDVGYESGTTVTADYTAATSRFTGAIHWVQIDLRTDDHDHFIDPEERMRIAMAPVAGPA